MNPIPNELTPHLAALTPVQLAWLSGYCWAKANGETHPDTLSGSLNMTSSANAESLNIHIVSASQTGNARGVAQQLSEKLTALGVAHQHSHAADFKPKSLAENDIVLLITSTQGEGEPPEEAVSLHKFLHGKKAPKLNELRFAVLGLGDSSYPKFCGAAREFDAKLADLGASRLMNLTECDLDFQAAAQNWVEQIGLQIKVLANSQNQNASQNLSGSLNASSSPENAFSKEKPFAATLLTRQKITGRGSDKDVRHIELDLSGSGMTYQVGDALGVWFSNDVDLVDEILNAVGLADDENLRDQLVHKMEITQNTPQFVKNYAAIAQNADLNQVIGDDVNAFVQANPIVGIVQKYPTKLSSEQLLGLLRPIAPRLYSISSAQDEVGEEVHLTVGALRYEHDGKIREGGASSFLARRAAEDGQIHVFVEQNPHFRLPENPATPIIMIGAGTGIAPFRAFVQQRAASEATGENWLIFGNPHASEDFLYQTEWQQFAKDGYLHRYHFAWSRDQAEKIYVQDKIRENAQLFWQWLQNGAHVYVCGDASKMAKDVERALIDVIESQGKMSRDDAEEWLDELRQNKRYQRDVY
ncbi:assimilatory sulfite reductase (NADPH) flavoprotein subunit [Alysiella filiformis]|uniref:Sulfite reductase [NADPH] flavoprotein alpha-component n=1 Tax=Alysiella filiformis DSM 16848 TaxID=1120981 RepID=A0A286E748_9NEIS|nr:assimilatory sulfite reductase (NADPH) flavoprotein subunit [Alysiella filiformis]QMT31568.1 assimilatory sulfite reductase (NADPH) flavoprotein subunit [Alysiella filiformis]UBQ55419.1 assimilatory sulfite reductase (NADPH) flavoprotein subunit [Alysiella filiformis DSM 16848]SOD66713.1 sulfite reductase (NADPH) flavoprotein alpha-component [Alysiella filiformis DSM 16848]